jgi:hypothetical protein
MQRFVGINSRRQVALETATLKRSANHPSELVLWGASNKGSAKHKHPPLCVYGPAFLAAVM